MGFLYGHSLDTSTGIILRLLETWQTIGENSKISLEETLRVTIIGLTLYPNALLGKGSKFRK